MNNSIEKDNSSSDKEMLNNIIGHIDYEIDRVKSRKEKIKIDYKIYCAKYDTELFELNCQEDMLHKLKTNILKEQDVK